MKKRFHYRSFVSFLLFFTIVWLLISGTILYVSPPGRVANWQHWTLFGFEKSQWQAQHIIFSYFFVIISVFHIFSLNWRNLWSYAKLKTKSGFRKKREFLVATVLILIAFFGTSFELPPFSSFFELGETITHSWEEEQRKGPIPHTEDLTLNEISTDYLKIDEEEIIKKLEANGVSVNNESQTLLDIAADNGKSPAEIYSILVPRAQQRSGRGDSGKGDSGRGYGRMTIEDIADDLNVGSAEIIARLKENNIEAKSGQTIRDIASEYALHPSEIAGMLRDH
ncbi:MAG: DUF4405 domain-containing protein [Cyclobacteriaceae bacterium]|nr:DUF4405 domain-containing protein [Cyclobacteriaceae bacterium]